MKNEQAKKLCQICKECSSKYKCPSCYLLYCSLACFKSHKGNLCDTETHKRQLEQQPQEAKCPDYGGDGEISEDEDTISQSDFEKLGTCDITKSMLKNKDLREIIAKIDQAQDPETLLRNSMQEPLFSEFVNHCLSVVEPNHNKSDICN